MGPTNIRKKIQRNYKIIQGLVILLLGLSLFHCKSNENISGSSETFYASIGGQVLSLNPADVIVLRNLVTNETVSVSGTGDVNFTFLEKVKTGSSYHIVIDSDTTGTCYGGGLGTVYFSNVNDIYITCNSGGGGGGGTMFFVQFNVTGLSPGSPLVMQNGSGTAPIPPYTVTDTKTVYGIGSYIFPIFITTGDDYEVTVATQPTGPVQNCTVTNPTGTITANVINVNVACTTSQFTFGGIVQGLNAATTDSVTLKDMTSGQTKIVTDADANALTDEAFAFGTPVNDESVYDIQVIANPAGKTCTVSYTGTNKLAGAPANNIIVTCSAIPTYSIGGTVTGLNGTVKLTNTINAETVSISADGSFTFPTKLTQGTNYNVSINPVDQPTRPVSPVNQNCTVTNGASAMGTAAVNNIIISCSTLKYFVDINVTGLTPADNSIELTNNGADNKIISGTAGGNATGTFATSLFDGTSYSAVIINQPAGTTPPSCAITAGGNTQIAGANATVTVTCTPVAMVTVSGTVNNLNGTIKLDNNAGDTQTVTGVGNIGYSFTALANGSPYAVTVNMQPDRTATPASPVNQDCTVGPGAAGTLAAPGPKIVNITCATKQYTVAGTVIGLDPGNMLRLVNNGSTLLVVNGDPTPGVNETFTFTGLTDNVTYNVSVLTSPSTTGSPASASNQTCTVTNGLGTGTGTITGANVTGLVVNCSSVFKVAATVTGLTGAGLVVNNAWGAPMTPGNENLSISADGVYTFPTKLLDTSSYQITVGSNPVNGQTCTVTAGGGPLNIATADAAATITCSGGGGGPTPIALSLGVPVTGTVSSGTAYYKITGLNPATNYKFTLNSLTGNANLYVYNSSVYTTLVCTSVNNGATPEQCTASGSPDYYINITDVDATNPGFLVIVGDATAVCGNGTIEVGETCDFLGDTSPWTNNCSQYCQTEPALTVGGNAGGGGGITGLGPGETLNLVMGLETLPVTGDGSDPMPFTFTTTMLPLETYYVTVQNPFAVAGKVCYADNATQYGSIGMTAITNVLINCIPPLNYSITVRAVGLGTGKTLTVDVNGIPATVNIITGTANNVDPQNTFPLEPGVTIGSIPNGTAFTVNFSVSAGTCTSTNNTGTVNGANLVVDFYCVVALPANDSYESNNTKAEADLKSFVNTDGSYETRSIEPIGDIDYMRLNVTDTNVAYTIRIRDINHNACTGPMLTVLILYKWDGAALVEMARAMGSTTGNFCSTMTYKFSTPGVYYLRVSDAYNSNKDMYTISVSKEVIIYSEDFTNGFVNFTSIDNGSTVTPANNPAKQWFISGAVPRDYDALYFTNWVPFYSDGQYAVADSDYAGSGSIVTTELRSSYINISSYQNLRVEYDLGVRYLTGQTLSVQVSWDNGATWPTVLKTYNVASVIDYHESVVLPVPPTRPPAAKSMMLRFVYNGTFDYYVVLDNIKVIGW